MKLKDVMTRNVEVIRPEATLMEAARIMKEKNVGSLPVCDGDRLLGIITDRDLVVRALAEKRDIADIQIKTLMSTPIVYAFEDHDVDDAARIMEVKKIRRIAVLSRDKKLVGIASIDNFAENRVLAGEVLAHLVQSQAA
jgi:CBS domain-containing protein